GGAGARAPTTAREGRGRAARLLRSQGPANALCAGFFRDRALLLIERTPNGRLNAWHGPTHRFPGVWGRRSPPRKRALPVSRRGDWPVPISNESCAACTAASTSVPAMHQ